MADKCKRCGAERLDVVPGEDYPLWDWCGECYESLCEECMNKGCCKVVPAFSGLGKAARKRYGLPTRTAVPSRAGVEYGERNE